MVFTILTIVFIPVFTPTDSFHGFRALCVQVAVPPAHVKTCTALKAGARICTDVGHAEEYRARTT